MINYSEYKLNILNILLRSGAAQIISLIAILLAARMYSPEDFSVYGIYTALVSIILTFAMGRIDFVIIQVDEYEYENIIFSSITLLLLSVFCVMLFLIFLPIEEFTNKFLIILFFGLISTGLVNIYSNLLSSQERYKDLGFYRIISSFVFLCVVVLLHLYFPDQKNGLLIANVVGQFFSAFLHISRSQLSIRWLGIGVLLDTIKKYKDYVGFDSLSSLANTLARQLPALIFPFAFGQTIAGYFFFAQRLIAAPTNLIANSVGNVFRRSATNEYLKVGNFKSIFLYTFYRLFAMSIVFGIIIQIVLNDSIILWMFGDQWVGSLPIIRLVIILYMFKFTFSPLSYSLYIVRRLHWNLIGQLIYIIAIAIPIVLGVVMHLNYLLTLSLYVLMACFVYMLYGYFSYKCAKK